MHFALPAPHHALSHSFEPLLRYLLFPPGASHKGDGRGAAAEALVGLTRDKRKRRQADGDSDAAAAAAAGEPFGLGAGLPSVAKTCPSWWLQDTHLVKLLEGTRFALCFGVGVSPSLVTVPVTEANLKDAHEAARLFDNTPRGRLVCSQLIQAWARLSQTRFSPFGEDVFLPASATTTICFCCAPRPAGGCRGRAGHRAQREPLWAVG